MTLTSRLLQSLPRFESALRASPLGSIPIYDQALTWAYFQYKRYIEDDLQLLLRLRPDLGHHGTILDVGGGMGYTAATFAQRVDPSYFVHVFEPEPTNRKAIQSVLRHYHLESRVRIFDCAVSDENGQAEFLVNPRHRGDHRLKTSVSDDETSLLTSVPVVRLDTHLMDHDLADTRVALVKIDVQGSEPAVIDSLSGLTQSPPLLVEFHPPSLQAAGYDPFPFFSRLEKYGEIHFVEAQCLVKANLTTLKHALARKGYIDLLCEP